MGLRARTGAMAAARDVLGLCGSGIGAGRRPVRHGCSLARWPLLPCHGRDRVLLRTTRSRVFTCVNRIAPAAPRSLARRCFRCEGAYKLRPVCRHRCNAMRCYSQAQGEGPLQLKYSSQLNTATHTDCAAVTSPPRRISHIIAAGTTSSGAWTPADAVTEYGR